jgi:hypothetical protein
VQCSSPNSFDEPILSSSPSLSSSFEVEQSSFKRAHSPDRIKSKRLRTIFTNEQLERLEVEFEKQQYMVGHERLHLARVLNLTETQVKVERIDSYFNILLISIVVI